MALEPLSRRLDKLYFVVLPGRGEPIREVKFMKVLLRDEKGFYYKCEEEWTACADSAVDFKRTFAAIEFAWDKGLDSTEVVLWFDNPEYDISLPVRAVQGNGKR